MSQFKNYHPSGNLKFNNLGILQILKLRIVVEKKTCSNFSKATFHSKYFGMLWVNHGLTLNANCVSLELSPHCFAFAGNGRSGCVTGPVRRRAGERLQLAGHRVPAGAAGQPAHQPRLATRPAAAAAGATAGRGGGLRRQPPAGVVGGVAVPAGGAVRRPAGRRGHEVRPPPGPAGCCAAPQRLLAAHCLRQQRRDDVPYFLRGGALLLSCIARNTG